MKHLQINLTYDNATETHQKIRISLCLLKVFFANWYFNWNFIIIRRDIYQYWKWNKKNMRTEIIEKKLHLIRKICSCRIFFRNNYLDFESDRSQILKNVKVFIRHELKTSAYINFCADYSELMSERFFWKENVYCNVPLWSFTFSCVACITDYTVLNTTKPYFLLNFKFFKQTDIWSTPLWNSNYHETRKHIVQRDQKTIRLYSASYRSIFQPGFMRKPSKTQKFDFNERKT